MTPESFRAWRKPIFRTQAAAGEALGKARETIAKYETRGVAESESRTIGLAMSAIAAGLVPYGNDEDAPHTSGSAGSAGHLPS